MDTRAVVYARISRDVGLTGLGVERQRSDCVELVEHQRWQLIEVFEDNDVSAYSGKPRPGFDAMCELIRGDGADVVVAWHPDRLTRQPRELEDLIDLLEKSNTTVRTVQTGEYDLSTPSGRMSARIVGAVARHESEHKSERIKRKAAELAEAGKVSGGGHRPFGFEHDRITIRADEAKTIRAMARKVLAGASIRSIVGDLDRRGVSTATGMPWRSTTVRRILMAPRTAGLREHRGEIVGQAIWDAIIDPKDLHRLRALLLDPARRLNRTRREYLLTGGLAACALCEAKLVARPRGDGARCYVCAGGPNFDGCGKIRVLAEDFETYVVDEVLDALDGPMLAGLLARPPVDEGDDPTVELERVVAKLSELGEMWATGELDRASWQAARDRLEKDRQAAEGRLRESTKQTTALDQSEPLRERWPSLDLNQRRAVLDVVLDQVRVGAAVRGRNFFDPQRIELVWKVR